MKLDYSADGERSRRHGANEPRSSAVTAACRPAGTAVRGKAPLREPLGVESKVRVVDVAAMVTPPIDEVVTARLTAPPNQ